MAAVEDLHDYYPYHSAKSYKDGDPLRNVVLRHNVLININCFSVNKT